MRRMPSPPRLTPWAILYRPSGPDKHKASTFIKRHQMLGSHAKPATVRNVDTPDSGLWPLSPMYQKQPDLAHVVSGERSEESASRKGSTGHVGLRSLASSGSERLKSYL